jgi:hypothetical protein
MTDSSFNFGHFVSDFVHSIPQEPTTPQGQLVSSFVHALIPGDPYHPGEPYIPGEPYHPSDPYQPGDPIEPLGQIVSDFVHELHHPTTTLIGLGADPGLIT